jgi:hypothetical protein
VGKELSSPEGEVGMILVREVKSEVEVVVGESLTRRVLVRLLRINLANTGVVSAMCLLSFVIGRLTR